MTEWRWGCVRCVASGVATGPGDALVQERWHEVYDCPATALTFQDVSPLDQGRLRRAEPDESYSARMSRRAQLHAAYPDSVPAYDKPYRDGRRWAGPVTVRPSGDCSRCARPGSLYPSGIFCDACLPWRAR